MTRYRTVCREEGASAVVTSHNQAGTVVGRGVHSESVNLDDASGLSAPTGIAISMHPYRSVHASDRRNSHCAPTILNVFL